MHKVFTSTRSVRFADCDPAGIVYYPQYMVMLNVLHEEWFDQGLGIPYAGVIAERRLGLPTVRLEVDFTAISRHGEVLSLALAVARLGRSSMTLAITVSGKGANRAPEQRLHATQVLVCTSLLTHRPQALPDDVRAAIQPFVAAATT